MNKISNWPYYSLKERQAVNKVLLSNKVNYWTGNKGKKLEKIFSNQINVKYSVALANGTVALDLALMAIGIEKGDEIIVTPRTYIASVLCVLNLGAVPVFADVDLNSGNLTANSIRKSISKKTKAVICVHLGGFPCEIDEIVRLTKKNKIYLVEDCSQAHGAKFRNRHVGTFGDVSTWSFCQDKIISTGGEGGMISTNSKNLWKKIWTYKDHGKNFSKMNYKQENNNFKWLHDNLGSNFRMTEAQAVIGIIQLSKLNLWNKKRRKNAKKIMKICEKFPHAIRVPNIESHLNHAFYRCYIYIKQDGLKKGWNRNRIISSINKLGLPCFVGSCPEVYKENVFKKYKYRIQEVNRNAIELGKNSIAFLVHPTLTDREISKACGVIKKVFSLASK